MTAPRDWHAEDHTGWTRAARLFSNIVSPPVIFAVVGLVLALYSLPAPQALTWAATYGLFVSLLPILFVLWLLETGRVQELHMSDTGERQLPYFVAIVCALFFLTLIVFADGPDLLRCLGIFNLIALSALSVINTRWLISFHATAISAAWAITALVFGWLYSLPVLALLGLVIAVRLYLRRHTVSQVLGGLALGAGTVLLLTFFGCFV